MVVVVVEVVDVEVVEVVLGLVDATEAVVVVAEVADVGEVVDGGNGGSGRTAGMVTSGNVNTPRKRRRPITSLIMPGDCRIGAACPAPPPRYARSAHRGPL